MLKPHNYHAFICLTLFFTFFFTSCSKDEEKIIPEKKFIEVLSDVMIIENLAITREEKLELLKRTFDKNDISSEDFTRTRKHYEKDADFWIRVYYRVQQRIKDKSTL